MTLRNSLITATLLFVVLTSGDVFAVTAVVAKDTYITSAAPVTSNAGSPVLNVSGISMTLLGFDLASVLPPGTTEAQVVKATLHLWENKSSANAVGTVCVQLADRMWTGQMTFANPARPTPIATPKTTANVLPGNNDLAVDVTAHVKQMIGAPTKDYGFIIVAGDGRVNVDLDAKEATHPAVLDITLAGQKSFVVCIEQHANNEPQPTCDCRDGKALYSVRTLGSCFVTSDTGSCGASGAFGLFWAACCVCLPPQQQP